MVELALDHACCPYPFYSSSAVQLHHEAVSQWEWGPTFVYCPGYKICVNRKVVLLLEIINKPDWQANKCCLWCFCFGYKTGSKGTSFSRKVQGNLAPGTSWCLFKERGIWKLNDFGEINSSDEIKIKRSRNLWESTREKLERQMDKMLTRIFLSR